MTLGPRCKGCPLKAAGGTGWVVEAGKGERKIAIIAEAPGEEEARASIPLVGKAGKVLDRIIERTPYNGGKLKRDDFWYTNILRCRPPDNHLTGAPYEEGAIAQCAPYLMEWLKAKKPKAIVALGNQALRWFTQQWGIEQLRGYIWPTQYGPVVASYHPSYIMRGKWSLARVVQLDIVRALEVAEHGIPKLPKQYILRPSPMDVWKFIQEFEKHPEAPLSFDIETPHSSWGKDEEIDPEMEEVSVEDDASYTILRISFAFAPGQAITFPWQYPYVDLARRLLASPNAKITWNGLNFDIPRLEFNGAPVNGLVLDGMDMFHFLEPALPMGLKYAATIYCPDMPPWKLKAKEEPEWYSAADSDVALRCVLRIRELLEKQGRWETFQRHFIDLAHVLRKMSHRGVLVDKERRNEDFKSFEAKRAEIFEGIQKVVPEQVLPRKRYKLSKERLMNSGRWVEGRMREWK